MSEAVARISDAGGALLGIVINRVPRRKVRKDAYPEFSERRQKRTDTDASDTSGTGKVEDLPGPSVTDNLPSPTR